MSNDKESAVLPLPRKPAANRPWVEKYRPKDLTQVSHQSEVVATLQNAVETGRLPHLLFYGPPGSGKTSVALALCRQLWHPRDWQRRVLELNASDERGISVVRDKIKHFASLAVGQATTKTKKNYFGQPEKEDAADTAQDQKKYPNPPFKVIILDEADTVTPDAQAALRRIIEAHSRITRFILICNYVTRIIEPLASRCAKFRFQSLPPESMKARLTEIAHAECGDDDNDNDMTAVVDEILKYAGGDMRRAVTTLQSVHSTGLTADTADAIAELAGLPPTSVVNALWASMNQSQFATMQAAVDDACASGFSAQLLVAALLDKILAPDCDLNELSKAEIAIRIAEAEKNMTEGADEYLQFMTVATLVLTCHQKSARELNQPTAMVVN